MKLLMIAVPNIAVVLDTEIIDKCKYVLLHALKVYGEWMYSSTRS